jgi:hypothetical protein
MEVPQNLHIEKEKANAAKFHGVTAKITLKKRKK